MMRQPVGPRVQLAVGQRHSPCTSATASAGLPPGLEQLVQAAAVRVLRKRSFQPCRTRRARAPAADAIDGLRRPRRTGCPDPSPSAAAVRAANAASDCRDIPRADRSTPGRTAQSHSAATGDLPVRFAGPAPDRTSPHGMSSRGVSVRPGSVSVPSRSFCHANITWKIGVCGQAARGCTISTTCSNGRSGCACAASVAS